MVIKKIFFLEFLEKKLYKILIEVVFKCKSNDLLFNVWNLIVIFCYRC